MKFRKKPVVIEAFQMTLKRMENNSDWPGWLHEAWNKEPDEPGSLRPWGEISPDIAIVIETLEGSMIAEPDDWIIQGIKGELYPCKPDIFEATYDRVTDDVITKILI